LQYIAQNATFIIFFKEIKCYQIISLLLLTDTILTFQCV
jgi:hypothetical protein